MAGDINLQPFIDQLFSAKGSPATTGQPSARPPDWQQSLMQSVDPETQKRERIRSFLANFGQALSSTPGNFLQGLAAGAGKGAKIYNDERSEDTQKRTAAQKLIADFQQKQEDRSTDQLKDKLSIGRGLNNDRDADADRIYNRGRQKKQDERADKSLAIAERRADTDAKRMEARLPKNNGGPLTQWQQEQTLTALDNLVAKFQTSLGEALDEEEATANQAAVEAYRRKLYDRRGFDPDTGTYLRGQEEPGILPGPQPELFDNSQGQPGGSSTPQTKVLDNRSFVKKNGKWFEVAP